MRRIVDLSESAGKDAARLRVAQGCLLITRGGAEESAKDVRIPAHEISVLIVGYRLSLTGAVLGAVSANGGAVLSLDDRMRPVGLMLPTSGSSLHAARLRLQIEILPRCAPRLWKQIVQAKITAQAKNAPKANLEACVEQVDDGDTRNIEAQASRAYWRALFGGDFKRSEDDDANSALNYGYAALRALVARAVCAAGLAPALGIHHHGHRDSFALADDLMEPARPIVDRVVLEMGEAPLDSARKRRLLGALLTEVQTSRGNCRLIDAYELVAQSLVDVLEGKRSDLEIFVLP